MWSLRTRFTVLLVVAVLLVMLMAAFVTAQMLRKPPEEVFDSAIVETAEVAATLLRLDPSSADRLAIPIGARPADTRIDSDMTERVETVARLRGDGIELLMLHRDEGGEAAADRHGRGERHLAVRIDGDRWAYLTFPGRGPFPLKPLSAYLALVALGVVAVAVYASAVMTRPLRVLETAAATMRPDGVIPEIAESGPIEVRTTARTINRLASRLNAAIASRMRLVAAAGHDLRTPMTRMRLRAEFIVDAEERAAWLKDLEELDHIADSAIRLVREEAGSSPRQAVALNVLAANVAEELVETGLPVGLGVLEPAPVLAAPFTLKRAILNLVANAATHGGGATLSVTADAEVVRLVVCDGGPGIPDDLLDRVFEPFFRVDEARRKVLPGAGLGLAIAREIIENHGGTVRIVNRPEGGLRQTVTLARLLDV